MDTQHTSSSGVGEHTGWRPEKAARLRWGVAAVLSIGGMVGFGWLMAGRITQFHKENARDVFAFRKIEKREFTFHDRLVKIEDDRSVPTQPVLVVHYGDAVQRIPVAVPPAPNSPQWKLPNLMPHEDWLRVLLMAPREGMEFAEWQRRLEHDELDERLLLVARLPRPGSDPETWGSVWKKDWVFDFYELMPDGAITKHQRLKYPSTSGIAPPREGELHENTWQFQAALQTMPQAGTIGPAHNFFGNAIAAAGWTLPAAMFSGLFGTIAFVFALAPDRRGRGSWRDSSVQSPNPSRA